MIREALIVLLQKSVYVHDSVMSPPQLPGGTWTLKVDITDPLIPHGPVIPLV
jgi:hypothetical protein